MRIDGFITTEVFDRDGKLRYRRRRRSKSFVQGFLAVLHVHMKGSAATVNFKDTGGTDRLIGGGTWNFYAKGPVNDDTVGVVVGTGTNIVDATDYALQTQVAHGSGSGQLAHRAGSISAVAVADPNVSFTLTRDFLNESGATITIKEEGIYSRVNDSEANLRYFCIVRDKETTGVAVADGENLRVTYTIQTST